MLTDYLKKSIATGAFNAQDLGGKSVGDAINSVVNKTEYPDQSDHLTAYLVDSINNATDIDDIATDIDYAISQLKRAKDGVLYGQLI